MSFRSASLGLIACLFLGAAALPAAAAPQKAPQTAPRSAPAAWLKRAQFPSVGGQLPVGTTLPNVGLRPPVSGRPPIHVIASGITTRAPGARASNPQVLDSYPRDGGNHIPPDAVLYYVFDQPTLKVGIFSVADLDSSTLPLLNLNAPVWSALGDTVFLKPVTPMTRGHQHGMLVNLVVAVDSTASVDVGGVRYFRIFPWPKIERNPKDAAFSSVTLVPGTPIPVVANVRELNGDGVTFTTATIEFWDSESQTLSGGAGPAPLLTTTVPVMQTLPRAGSARLTAPVTLPTSLAATAASGRLGLRIVYQGTDETGYPITFASNSSLTLSTPPDTLLAMSPALVVPAIAANLVVQAAYLDAPLPGATFAAGDTVRASGVVTGIGTGPFRAVFYLDGTPVAMEEGYMESGRPVTVEPRGPIVSRRFGEHRFQFVVESPQNVASQPITFLCMPPAHGVIMPVSEVVGDDSVAAPRPPSALQLNGTYMLVGKSDYRDQGSAGIAWSAWDAHYDVSKTASLRGNVLWRLRVDDVENGTAAPEQFKIRYEGTNRALEWGDVTPNVARDAPLFASALPRRSAQVSMTHTPVGDVEGFVALDSHPRSAAGPILTVSSDLYAGRISHSFASDRLFASLYGGYTHDDPTPGSVDSVTTASAVYGGMGRVGLAGDWTLMGDVATVRHRAIEGVDPGRSRTAVRSELKGDVAGFTAKAEGFRYQPDLQTTLNPYAISDRRGMAAELARDVSQWRLFATFRTEQPEEAVGVAPVISVDRWTLGGQLKLNQVSVVIPTFVRIQQRGDNTEYNMSRVAGELVVGEALGGQTRARIDLTKINDAKGVNTGRFVGSASLVTTRKHSDTITSTISAALEHDESKDLNLTDQTIQAALEIRFEAIRGKLLITPLATYYDRDMATINLDQRQISGRLQISILRVPKLGENALSIEGRIDNYQETGVNETSSTEGGVEVSFGQRFNVLK